MELWQSKHLKIQAPLKTQRLCLRPFNLQDAPRVRDLAGDYEVARTTLNIPHPYKSDMAVAWISMHESWRENRKQLVYAISLDSCGSVIGAIGLSAFEEDSAGLGYWTAELGYWIGKPYWGNGYCTEATQALFAYAQSELDLCTIIARHIEGNDASGQVMLNAGMQFQKSESALDRDGKQAIFKIYSINLLEKH